MEINVLQSLIDRTSNQIAEHEACIQHAEKELNGGWPCDLESQWLKGQLKYVIGYHKQRLPQLRKIQKELKKEIAQKLRNKRLRLNYLKDARERRKVSILREDVLNANNS